MNDSLLVRRRAHVRWSALGVCFALLVPHVAFAQGAAEPAPAPSAEDAAAEAAETDANANAEADEAAAAEAELAAEEKASLEKSQKPAPKGKGVVWGTVTDTKFNEAVVEAQIQVQGQKHKVFADVNGRYRLELPPGTYSLRASYELHRPSRVEVTVKAGELTHIDFELVPDESSVQEVVIEEEADHATNEGQTLERKRSAAVGDGVGRAEIARTPDKNAAEAAQRIVGATIVGGRFVYVRGLGERYTNALLNGAPMPSTEPDRNTVPLDLFPSLVLESLTINKQFLPDMPADFAGGSVRIKTREFPKQPLFELSLSGSINTASTFHQRPSYQGSSTDWLGFDGGRRGFPTGLPSGRLGFTDQDQVIQGHRFNTPMVTYTKSTPPNFRATAVMGNSWKIAPDAKLGAIAAFSYGRQYFLTDITQRLYDLPKVLPGAPEDSARALFVRDDYSGQQAIDSVRWGAFGSASLELSRRHTISLTGIHSQCADDSTSLLESPSSPGIHATHLEYVSRALNFLQLRGEHHYPQLSDLEINWNASLAVADRDQPDTRDVRYQRYDREGVGPGWTFVSDLSGTHQYLNQTDKTFVGGLDILQPLIRSEAHETKLKVGTLITSRRRDFLARRFQFVPWLPPNSLYNELSFCPGETWSGGCPNYLFRPEMIQPGGLKFKETTLDYDQYETGLDVYSGYAMVDAKPFSKLRAVAGARVEITYQNFSGHDPFDVSNAQRSVIYHTDFLPAVSLVYEATKKSNIRFGASQTLARPQLRELSPAPSTNSAGDLSVQGNPKLTLTKITNLDLRYEYFPTLREVLATSVFYKHFKDPIEEVVTGTGSLNFVNAPEADLVGAEFEGRKSLASLAEALRGFTIIGNLTLVYSRVHFGSLLGQMTNDNRPLAYSSPYVVNASLDYSNDKHGLDVRVLYNIYGPRIVAAGALTMPDTYEMPRNSLDFSAAKSFAHKHLELKLQILNILNAPVVFAYKDQQGFRELSDGRYESLGLNPETKRYSLGTTFALTGTYSY